MSFDTTLYRSRAEANAALMDLERSGVLDASDRPRVEARAGLYAIVIR